MNGFSHFRIIGTVTVICLSVVLTACSGSTTVPDTFYSDDYNPDQTQYTGLAGNSASSGFVPDTIHFMYEDICFEKEDVNVAGVYDFSSFSAACYDIDNKKVIFSKNVYSKIYPASTTKLLTALIAKRYLDLDDTILIEEDNCGIVTPGAKLCGFKAGDTLTVRDMLYCLLIYSGNDAAVALARKVSGTEAEFVKLMNIEAAAIGAKDTHFTNPHGLHDPQHFSTAYDIYLMFNECLKDDFLKSVFKTKDYYATITGADGNTQKVFMEPTNLYYAGKYAAPPGMTVYGGKTGVTLSAGNCLIIYSENEAGNGFVTEIFKASTKDILYNEMNELLKMCK